MRAFIKRLYKAARQYTIADYACLKTALFTLGLLLGAYFSRFILNYAALLWVIFLLSYAWVMCRTLIKYR